MSRSVNKIILIGNIGDEPEFRTTTTGKAVAKFSLATSYGTGDKERTQWHRITAWEKTAEIVNQYVHKGDRLYVEGSVEYSSTTADDGTTKYWTDIVAREVLLLSSPRD
jgi:single-strand DNA-binding protein